MHGLPSNECHDIVQDKYGYIWIATDRGVVKFDGYGFSSFGKSQGLGDIACIKLNLDSEGNIWISTVGIKFFKIDVNTHKISDYPYQKQLDALIEKAQITFIEEITQKGDFIFNGMGFGMIKISKTGKAEVITNEINQMNVYNGEKGSYLYSCKKNKLNFLINYKNLKIPFKKIQKPGRSYNFDKKQLLCFGNKRYFFNQDSLDFIANGDEINDIELLKNGEFLVAEKHNRGLKIIKSYSDFKKNIYSSILDNEFISSIFCDRDGNFFVTSLDNGLYYLQKSLFKPVLSFKGDVISLRKMGQQLLFIEDKKNIYSYNPLNNSSKLILKEGKELSDVEFIQNTNTYLYTVDGLKKFKGGKDVYMEYNGEQKFMNRLIQNESDTIIGLSSSTFYFISRSDLEIKYVNNDVIPKRYFSAVKVKNGLLYLGMNDGLYFFKNGNITKVNNAHPIFSARINDIRHFQNNYVLATLGNGIGIWDGKQSLIQLSKEDGLISDNIERVYFSKDSAIYACTKNGFSIITKKGEKWNIRNYTRHDGLSSLLVKDVIQIDNKIFVATAAGLYEFDPKERIDSLNYFKPMIESVKVNNNSYQNLELPNELSHDENTLQISFKTLNYNMFGGIEYMYSIDKDKWIRTKATELLFTNLKPGNYIFKIKSLNSLGQWSEEVKYMFKIKQVWWRTNWFYSLFALLLFGLSTYIIHYRLNKIKKESAIKEEISKLERSSLQAQMNPHFIYNCLNSIQNFIMKNEKLIAMDYLSKFAKLIRQNLDASTTESISLDQEISMLSTYLILEQMRFGNSFDFKIDIESSLDLITTHIPPLLIQPFVENAILHGVKDMPSDGLITIRFAKNDHQLIISIIDNGKGIKTDKPNVTKHTSHKSRGVEITQKRLEYLKKNELNSYMIYNNELERGTEVKILVNL
jgi:hypothetical protein